MEKLANRKSLKSTFSWMVFLTVVLVTTCSIVTILGCIAIRQSLVPSDDEILLTIRTISSDGQVDEERVYTHANGVPNEQLVPDNYQKYTEYVVEPIHSPIQLSPKKKLLYQALPVAMFMIPLFFTITGIVLCSFLFYHRKLKEPLTILTESAKKISNDHFDFKISYGAFDEMGMLCTTFEKMRMNLLDSKQMIWHMMEERRQLNASIAHDLRTPITIIEGYSEYLLQNVPKGKIDERKLMLTLSNIAESTKRLQHYVDSIRDIQSLDEMKLKKEQTPLYDTIHDMCLDLEILTASANKKFMYHIDETNQIVQLDQQALYRILENIISNATRYAEHTIETTFSLKQDFLSIIIHDDGPGFTSNELDAPHTTFYKEAHANTHMGLGLTISELLAKKHGGELTIDNAPSGGAKISILLAIK